MADSPQQPAPIGHNRPPDPTDPRKLHFNAAFEAFNEMVLKVVGNALSLPVRGCEADAVVEDVAAQAWLRVWRSGYVRKLDSHFYDNGEYIPLVAGHATFESAKANVLVQTKRAILSFLAARLKGERLAQEVELQDYEWEAIEGSNSQIPEGPSWEQFEIVFQNLGFSEQDINIMRGRHCEGWSIRNIADSLGIHRNLVDRALRRMRQALAVHYGVSDHGN
jgi:hypothetical protein